MASINLVSLPEDLATEHTEIVHLIPIPHPLRSTLSHTPFTIPFSLDIIPAMKRNLKQTAAAQAAAAMRALWEPATA